MGLGVPRIASRYCVERTGINEPCRKAGAAAVDCGHQFEEVTGRAYRRGAKGLGRSTAGQVVPVPPIRAVRTEPHDLLRVDDERLFSSGGPWWAVL